MKRIISLLLVFFSSTIGFGAPVGNPATPDLIHKGVFTSENTSVDFRIGYIGDWVADGRLEQAGGQRVDRFSQYTQSGQVTLNFVDRMDLYGAAGSSHVHADWRFNTPSMGTVSRIDIKTTDNLLWTVGGRMILFEWNKTSLGVGGCYSSCHYGLENLSSNGVEESARGAHFDWREWQINCDISYRVDLLIPYIGVKYSSAKGTLSGLDVPVGSGRELTNRIPVGLYLGCSVSNGKYFMLNLEGRLIDEEAVAISADLKF